jgi:hypothetical protein
LTSVYSKRGDESEEGGEDGRMGGWEDGRKGRLDGVKS